MQIKLFKISSCDLPHHPAYVAGDLRQINKICELIGTMKPSGSDGTFEEPVVTTGEYGSDLVAAWPKLSEKAKLNIHKAAEVYP